MHKFTASFQHLFHPSHTNNHRPRLLHPQPLFFLSLICLGFGLLIHQSFRLPGSLSDVLGYASSITPTQVVTQTNQQRARQGLPPLTYSQTLSAAAMAKGQDMMANQYWAHISPQGTEPWYFIKNAGYEYRAAGENLARDFSNTDDMVAAWMASPTHKANIINTKFEEIGIAVIDGELEGYETTLVVQMFGSPLEQIGQTSPDAPQLVAVVDDQPFEVEDPVVLNQYGTEATIQPTPQVLATFLVPAGELLAAPLLSPLHISKALFVAVALLIILTLVYDLVLIEQRKTARLVGKNIAHVMLFTTVIFIIIFFRGGMIN